MKPATYLVCCDAALSNTTGKNGRISSVGVAVLDADNTLVCEKSILVGGWTPNVTSLEYKALCLALEAASDLGVKRAVLVNDNNVAVRRMANYVKGPLGNVPKEIRKHIEGMESLVVRRAASGEERLPHDLAQKAISQYRSDQALKAKRAVRKSLRKADKSEAK